jgi:hypothetical protein
MLKGFRAKRLVNTIDASEILGGERRKGNSNK